MKEPHSKYEPTAWMRKEVQSRLREARNALESINHTNPNEIVAILIPLTSPPDNATATEVAEWEHSCDRCGHDCRTGEFFTGAITLSRSESGHQRPITMTFGLCDACHRLEHVAHDHD